MSSFKTAWEAATLDAACRLLRDIARERDVDGVELYVLPDGRVTIEFGDEKRIRADLHEGGAHPLPSVAIAEAVK